MLEKNKNAYNYLLKKSLSFKSTMKLSWNLLVNKYKQLFVLSLPLLFQIWFSSCHREHELQEEFAHLSLCFLCF